MDSRVPCRDPRFFITLLGIRTASGVSNPSGSDSDRPPCRLQSTWVPTLRPASTPTGHRTCTQKDLVLDRGALLVSWIPLKEAPPAFPVQLRRFRGRAC